MFIHRKKTEPQALLASKPDPTTNITIYIFNRRINYERRTGGKGTMGRFGGGWEVKFGFQAGSWSDLFTFRSAIFNLFNCMLIFGVQDERNNEKIAREKATKVVPS